MDLTTVAIVGCGLLLYTLVSGRLHGTVLTAPLSFIAFGWLIGEGGLGVAMLDPGHEGIRVLAELTLVVVLFSDAARIDLGALRRDHTLPRRMLTFGLPLAVVAGAAVAVWVFPSLSLWEAALLAALLAPTDAALGQVVVSARVVPVRIRQAINVESGLNDGFAVPAVLLFAALAVAMGGVHDGDADMDWVTFTVLQVTLGPVVGIAVGYLGGRCLDGAISRGWADEAFEGIGVLSLAIFAFVASELIGGNGFIAAFVGGMAFGRAIRNPCKALLDFMETQGQLFMLLTFLIFGAVLLPQGLRGLNASTLGYAVLSLTVIRMAPIALSLLGSGLRLPSVLFLGWFGPRGLASILFVLVILEHGDVPNHELILSVTVITVALSALLHGITAAPFATSYGRWAESKGQCAENQPVPEMPLRDGMAPRAVVTGVER